MQKLLSIKRAIFERRSVRGYLKKNVPKNIIRKHGAESYKTCLSMVNNINKINIHFF